MINDATPMSLDAELDAQRQKSGPERRAATDAQVAALVADGLLERSLQVGDRAPTFVLPDALGRPVSLSSALANGPVVLTFYRGEWCPYCNLQLHAYQAILPDITALGASLIAISPQTPDHSLSMVEKHALAFAVLSDVGNTIARQFGLVYRYDQATRDYFTRRGLDLAHFNGDASWDLPLAATYVIASDGVIRLAFVNPDYRQRLEPATLLESLRAITQEAR